MNNIIPPYLNKGDCVGILCTAQYVTIPEITFAIKKFEEKGLKIKTGFTIGEKCNTFGGTDQERANNFNEFLEDTSVKAIVIARGGYGTVRIIDQINFDLLLKNPKWIVGFSDVTALHCHINTKLNMATIHGPMLRGLQDKNPESVESLFSVLFGESVKYKLTKWDNNNRPGVLKGPITGGNMSLIYSMQSSVSELDTDGKILFIEEVNEYLYHIDRMMWNFKRSGKLKNIKGLLVGDIIVEPNPDKKFGMTYQEIIMEKVREYNYPVYFNFPAGHGCDNMAMEFNGNPYQMLIIQS